MSRNAPRPPRILFCTVTGEPGHGGIARVSNLLWRAIQQKFPDSCERLAAAPQGLEFPGLLHKATFSAGAAWRQISRRSDLLFFDHLGLARIQTTLPALLRGPYGVFLHSLEVWEPLHGSTLAALRGARLRIANSRYTAARVMKANPDAGAIDVCHLALAPGEEEAPREACVANQIRPKSVLIVGRMLSSERYKGHDQLIQAWPSVLKCVPDAHLVVVGRGDDIDRLKALSASLGVAQHVFFTGHVTDSVLSEVYRRAAVFAMPSRAEGFGIVYLEAMRHRLPCIGSIHDASGEIIVDGETGYLVEQNDLKSLAGRIVQLLRDADLRKRLGDSGFERLDREFSLTRFNVRISGLLDQLASDV